MVLPSKLEDELNQYVFPIAIQIVNGMKFALAPLYLRSLYVMLDEYINNITQAIRRFDVVTNANSSFIKMFIWGSFPIIAPKLVEFPTVAIEEVTLANGSNNRGTTGSYRP